MVHKAIVDDDPVAAEIVPQGWHEEVLLKAEALQSAIFNSANFSIIATDEKGMIQIFNVGAERMLGYAAADVMNKITPADISDPQEVIARAAALSVELGTPIASGFEALVYKASRGIEDIHEQTYIRKDGSRFPAKVSVTALRDAPDCIIGYLLIGTDNTARRQVEEERKRAEDEQSSSLKEIADLKAALDEHASVAITDPQGNITYVNDKFCAISKHSREELLGQDHRIINSGYHPKAFIHELWTTITHGKVWKGEIKNKAKDGSFYWVDTTIVPFLDKQGTPRQYVAIRSDITERKRAEEQLKASFKEVGDLNAEIQKFYHTLSHELKTPLTSAREFISIVMDGLAGPLNETQSEYLGIAKESCDQLRLYINDMLDVTRLQTGKMSLEFQALSLAALVERVVEMLAPAAAGKGVNLSCNCQPDLPTAPIDKQRILQVLTNLTTNAIKFTPRGGRILLSLSEAPADPECLLVAVRDTGRGIPQDQLDVIFDRLYQTAHNMGAVESPGGLGLGLYICQELVELHGGRIWAESEVGRGSTFSFVVPKRAKTKGAYVLIVDDDYAMRETLRLVLEDQNFEVRTAKEGSEVLRLMDQRVPDVVVLDLMMPGLDGPRTLKEIRMNWGLIPVIVYTGYPDSDLMRQAMEFSPFTLLAKAGPPKRFVETVRRMCHPHEDRFPKKTTDS